MLSKISISKHKVVTLFVIFALFSCFSMDLRASEPQETATSQPDEPFDPNATPAIDKKNPASIDITKVAFEHILDSHSWHFWGDEEEGNVVAMPLPVILKTSGGLVTFMSSAFENDVEGKVVIEKNGERFVNFEEKIYYASAAPDAEGHYVEIKREGAEDVVLNESPLDFSITKNVAQMFLSVIVLLLIFTSIARSYKTTGVTSAPRGKQSFFEPVILFVRDDIAKANIGSKYEKFVPYLLTVFFLILINNIFGLLPIGANLTGNIAFTLVMSVITLIVTNLNGNKQYWGHIFMPHAPKAIWIILIPIELVGIITKPFALMIRLFANMTAGHIIVISLIGLIFIFKTLYISPVSVAFALFIDVLEVLVAFLQAYIFTMLTALFIGSACADHNGDGVHNEDDEHALAKH